MSANKIKKPLLLIHGEEDNNSGTLTMQVKSLPLYLPLTFSNFQLNFLSSHLLFLDILNYADHTCLSFENIYVRIIIWI